MNKQLTGARLDGATAVQIGVESIGQGGPGSDQWSHDLTVECSYGGPVSQ